MTILLLLAALSPAWAACPDLPTFPEDGRVGVPPEIGAFWVKPLTQVDGVRSPDHPCLAESLTLARADDPDTPLIESQHLSLFSRAELPALEANVTYRATVTRIGGEATTSTFETGSAHSGPQPAIAAVRIEAGAAGAGEPVCATAEIEVDGADAWTVVSVNLGQPTPWRRVIDAGNPVPISTRLDSIAPFYTRQDEQACFGVWLHGAAGLIDEQVHCVDVDTSHHPAACPGEPTYEEERACATAPVGGLSLGALAAVLLLARRRPRRQ